MNLVERESHQYFLKLLHIFPQEDDDSRGKEERWIEKKMSFHVLWE